ncbi:MAG: M15 family metallopeptidase [Acidimicrobiales bacterium]
MWRRREHDSRGQAMVLVAIICWLVAVAALLLAGLGARAIRGAQVQAGADATALAAAVDPDDAAPVAAANDVAVESVTVTDRVEVIVGSSGVRAGAAAELFRPEWQGLQPGFRAALARAEALLGMRIPIVSGLRTRAEQEALWANRHTNPYPVAVPGTSLHERGLAVDVPLGFAPLLAGVGPSAGVCQPLPVSDPVHFVLCETRPTR